MMLAVYGNRKVEAMSETSKPVPLPSGAMYIGICNMRAQSVTLRWQKTIVLATVNVTLMGVWFQFFKYNEVWLLAVLCVLATIASLLNFRYAHGLAERSSQWIEYYTRVLKLLEEASGTETGIRAFSDPEYISRMDMEHHVRGIRFRKGMQSIVLGIAWTWLLGALVSGLLVAYHLGRVGF